jgi:hypothetical protein
MSIYFRTLSKTCLRINIVSLTFLLFINKNGFSQNAEEFNRLKKNELFTQFSKNGLDYIEVSAYNESFIGDGMLSILKLNPKYFDFQLICKSQTKVLKSATQWIDSLNGNIIFNAGMYNLQDEISHQFFMKNFEHMNNPILSSNVNGIIAFNPSKDSIPKLQLFDLTMDNWDDIKKSYQSLVQGYRMIDCNGEPVFWNNRFQSCSMSVLAQDKENNVYFIFSRSPFTQNQMIENLLNLPFKLLNAIYLEGGSRANFILSSKQYDIRKVGSYVSTYNPNDKNKKFFPVPNFIVLTQIKF